MDGVAAEMWAENPPCAGKRTPGFYARRALTGGKIMKGSDAIWSNIEWPSAKQGPAAQEKRDRLAGVTPSATAVSSAAGRVAVSL